MDPIDLAYGSVVAIRLFIRSLEIVNTISTILMAIFCLNCILRLIYNIKRNKMGRETEKEYLFNFGFALVGFLLAAWVWTVSQELYRIFCTPGACCPWYRLLPPDPLSSCRVHDRRPRHPPICDNRNVHSGTL